MMPRDPTARMDEVTASAPRIGPPSDAELAPRAEEMIERLCMLHGIPMPVELHPFYATLCRTPEVFASFLQFGGDLSIETTLPARERELAILRTGWLCGAPYQWGEHVAVAKREGIAGDEIERVREGSAAPGWSTRDRALLSAVEELHRDAMIADTTWSALATFLDERQRIELLMLIGHYHTTAFVQNALRIGLNPTNAGLMAG